MECMRLRTPGTYKSSPQSFATPAPALLHCSSQACFSNSPAGPCSARATRAPVPLKTTSFQGSIFGRLTTMQPQPTSSNQSRAAQTPSIVRGPRRCSNDHIGDESVLNRRTLVGILAWVFPYFTPFPAPAAPDDSGNGFNFYKDEEQGYGLYIPDGWVQGEGKATGERKLRAFFPVNDTSTNVNILITNIAADFTSLGSFGPVDSFAETLVNGLDRSWQKPPGQSAKLMNARSRNGLYYVEYTIQKPGERMRHLLSAVGMGSKGSYNKLFTATGQFWEEELDQYKEVVEKVVSSFRVL